MKFKPEKKYVSIGLTLFFTAIAIMVAFFILYRQASIKEGIKVCNKILAPIIYGLVIAYLLTPILNWIERKVVKPFFMRFEGFKKKSEKKQFNISRKVSLTITIVLTIVFFYAFFTKVITEIYSSIQSISSFYPTYTANFLSWMNGILDKYPKFANMLENMIKNYSSETDDWIKESVLPLVSKIFPDFNTIFVSFSSSILKFIMFLWNIIIGFIISVYVLSSKEKFARSTTKMLYAFLENNTANKFLDGIRFTHHKFIGFFSGKVVDSFIIGLICFAVLTILKMPYVVLISFIVGVTNIIPFFGPWFGAIPSVIIILMVEPKKALVFIIFVFILQQFDGNFLGPKILSESTGISSFWIICSITIFSGFFGVIGMIIAVPVTAVIIAFVNTLTNTLLSKKHLPTDTENYDSVASVNDEGEFTKYVYVKPKKNKPQGFFERLFDKIFKKKNSEKTKSSGVMSSEEK